MSKSQWSLSLLSVGTEKQSAITAPVPSPGHTPEVHLGMGSASVQDQTLSTMQSGKIPLAKPLGRVLRNNNLLPFPFYTRDIQKYTGYLSLRPLKNYFLLRLMPSYSTCS